MLEAKLPSPARLIIMSLGSSGSVESRNAESRHSKNQREIGIVESRNPESQHSKKSKENAQHVVEVIFCIWFAYFPWKANGPY